MPDGCHDPARPEPPADHASPRAETTGPDRPAGAAGAPGRMGTAGAGGETTPGSVADEAARLLTALRARRTTGTPPGADTTADGPDAPDGVRRDAQPDDEPLHGDAAADDGHRRTGRGTGDGPDAACCACPLCAGMRAVRGIPPETYASVADAAELAASAMTALAGVLRRRTTSARAGATGGPEATERPEDVTDPAPPGAPAAPEHPEHPEHPGVQRPVVPEPAPSRD